MSSHDEQPLGYVTIRIPIFTETESESWEMPQEYTVLAPEQDELVSHDMPFHWHDSLREQLVESGIELAYWTPEQIAATCTLPADTESAPFPYPHLLDLFNGQ